MDVRFPPNNPIKPCSVLDKICWYNATTNIKITELIPFTEKTNVKNRTFLVSMDVMSLDKCTAKRGYIENICHKAYEIFNKDNPFLHITCRKCLDKSSKKISSTSVESTTYKTMELQWAQRQQFWFLCQCFHDIYWNNDSKTVFRTAVSWDMSKPNFSNSLIIHKENSKEINV